LDIVVTGRNVRVTDEVRAKVTSKIGTLDRFVSGLDLAEVVFKKERNPRIAEPEHVEITLVGHGHHLRCQSSGIDQIAAVDLAVEKLETQLRKLKTRTLRRHRPNSHREANHHPLVHLASLDEEMGLISPASQAASAGTGTAGEGDAAAAAAAPPAGGPSAAERWVVDAGEEAGTAAGSGDLDDAALAGLDGADDVAPPPAELVEPRIVRRKQFPLKAMSPDAAALRMELLDHQFYLFRNAETGEVAVVYHRDAGGYGLIEPAAD
jgi:ribosomal subunit interface protein